MRILAVSMLERFQMALLASRLMGQLPQGKASTPSSLGSRLCAPWEPGQGEGGNLIRYVIPWGQSRSQPAFHCAGFPSLKQL